ncbi:MAG: zinc ribbon domain-containing protein [Acidobacteriota bacterium]|nr:zinc ribbon domain-containing protein [Acidobacteriota bacterium]
MPLYEYQCDACAHRFELIQKFSDPPPAVCPKCGGAVKKLFSSPAIQFKGTGWYITDYARSGSRPEGKSDGGGSTSADSKSESKTESTTESKSKSESKSDGKTETKPSNPG